MTTKAWTIRVPIEEDSHHAHGTAVLLTGDAMPTRAEGRARRNLAHRPVQWIGEELAVSRALYALADRIVDVAVEEIDLAAGRG